MHMADALVSPAVGGTMLVLSTISAGYAIKKLRKEENLNSKISTMGMMGAFVFATQMLNFTIPGTGSSGHLCGGFMLSSILGPYAGFIAMIGVLLIQCLFFADGGLLALGANIWNMAFYGCFLGTLIWKTINKNGFSKKKIWIASILGSVVTLQLGAFSVVIETLLSGITKLPFLTFLCFMQPIHLAIGLVEGVITAAVLTFIYVTRPEILTHTTEKENKLSYKSFLLVFMVAVVLASGLISLYASSNPDGLEWSILNITNDTELEADETTFTKIQDTTSIMPDYNFKDSESTIGASLSGVIGSIITLGIIYSVVYVIRLTKNKKEITINE